MSEGQSNGSVAAEPTLTATEASRLRQAAWEWVNCYRSIMWAAHNPNPGIHVSWEPAAMCPAELDEPLRSSVKDLLETFPDSWFEKERLDTYVAKRPLPTERRRKPELSNRAVSARLASFIGGAVALFLLFCAVFGSSLGLLGSLVDAVPPIWRAQIINGLASAGFLYAIRVWFAMWFGWMGQENEQLAGLMILWIGLSIGWATVSCERFTACPAPVQESACTATPSREGVIMECL
jgi:hypothetical protein